MEIRQLEIFLAIFETASVTRAAQRVYLTPGAVSQQLHHLEQELRTDLFARTAKRLIPTPAAHRLAEHARSLLVKVKELQHDFENDPQKDTRPFHFATGATTLIHRLGRPLRLLRKRYPHLPIQVTVAATEEMVAGLHELRFDLALITLPFPDENLTILPLFEEELLVIRPSATQIRGWHVGTIEPEEMAKAQFILNPTHSNMRVIIEGFFRDLGIEPVVTMEADDTEAIRGLVEAGFGYSILPEYALHRGARFFHPLRVPQHRVIRKQALAMAKTAYPRPLTDSITQFLQAALAE